MRFKTAYLLAIGIVHSSVTGTLATVWNVTSSASRTCTFLQAQLGPNIVQTSGVEYNASASNAWSLYNGQDKPTCIVFPHRASHVQTAMAAIFANKVHYAVQAGGHTAMTGWNTCVLLSKSQAAEPWALTEFLGCKMEFYYSFLT